MKHCEFRIANCELSHIRACLINIDHRETVDCRLSPASLPKKNSRFAIRNSQWIPAIAAIFAAIFACPALAQDSAPATSPATASAPSSASAPATTPAGVDPAVDALLDELEKAGQKDQTLEAKVTYTVDFPTTAERETRVGTVQYQKDTADSPAKFRLYFETFQSIDDPKPRPEKYEYAWDGEFFTEVKHKIQSMNKYQLAPKGEKIDPMKIAKGPFPLLFGCKKKDLLELFDITTRPPQKSDPAGSRYLRLVPKSDRADEVNYTAVQLWVDEKTFLPIQIVSTEKNKNKSTALFSDVKAGTTFKPEIFSPRDPGGKWNYHVEPYREKS